MRFVAFSDGRNAHVLPFLLAEVVDFQRFRRPRQLMAYLGLVPSEYSSGESRRRGALTKAGNSHARRVLVEAAWHYRHLPTIGRALASRSQGQPDEVVGQAWRAQQRLHRRYRHLVGHGKRTPVAVAAAMLSGLGFSAFQAAAICLIANTSPVAFGAIGTPLVTLAGVTTLPLGVLSANVGKICAPVSLFVPAYLMLVMGGVGALRAVLPAAVVCVSALIASRVASSSLRLFVSSSGWVA